MEQLTLPFIKTKFDLEKEKREQDEIFMNFHTVLRGKDVDLPHKQKVLLTLLDHVKSGNPELSHRSTYFLFDLFSELVH